MKSLSIVAAAAMALCAVSAQAAVNGLSNGSFEDAATVGGQFAQGWRGTNGPTPGNRTTDQARTGSYSAIMSVVDPGFGGSGIVQNSVDDGGLPALDPSNWGTAPTLSFWAKGNGEQVRFVVTRKVVTDYGHFGYAFAVPTTWKQITIEAAYKSE
jgi:hypothetical protein